MRNRRASEWAFAVMNRHNLIDSFSGSLEVRVFPFSCEHITVSEKRFVIVVTDLLKRL